MADYLFYTYFEDGREYFVYKDLSFERSHKKEKDFPFLESLLRFTYLDIWPMEDLFKKMDAALLNFYQKSDFDSQAVVMSTLKKLAKEHIYFEFLRLDWQSRFRYIERHPDKDIQKHLPHKQLRHIPSGIDTLQKQIMRLFEDVLDFFIFSHRIGLSIASWQDDHIVFKNIVADRRIAFQHNVMGTFHFFGSAVNRTMDIASS